MTETNLKPCPFCGGEDFQIYTEGSVYVVKCGQCETKVGALDEKTAIEYWNARPIEDELDKKYGYLIGTCHDLHDIVEDFRAECDQKDLEITRLREALEEIQDAITLLNTADVLEHISDKINQTLKGKEV